MSDLKILNVSDDIISSLDSVVKQKGYSDRSALIRNILSKYVQFGDDFLVKGLPDTIKLLVADSLKEYPEKLSNMLEFLLSISQQNVELLRKLNAYFSDEND